MRGRAITSVAAPLVAVVIVVASGAARASEANADRRRLPTGVGSRGRGR